MNDFPRIPAAGDGAPIAASTPAGGAPAATGAAASPRFQELLERLQRLAKSQPAPDRIDSPEQLAGALRTADDGFVAAMDLRKKLEEAFRRHLP